MSLIYSPTATASVASGTNTISIAGMDLSALIPGMVINLGARDRVKGDGYIISNVAATGSNGGTLTTLGNVDAAFNAAAFVIDTRDYNGTAPNYLIATYSQVLNALLKLTSPLTNLFSGSRVLALDKDTSAAISRFIFAIAGRLWAATEQRVSRGAETLAIRAYPDGTTPIDSLMVDLSTGGVDFLQVQTPVGSAATTDIGNINSIGVLITGSARIVSLGQSRNKFRIITFANSGGVLSHNTTLNIPSEKDITIRAGDRCIAISGSDGNWVVVSYNRIDGKAVVPSSAVEVGAEPALGYTPVQQGGGAGQNTNKLFFGWATGSKLKLQVDQTDIGQVWTDSLTALSQNIPGYMKLPNGIIIQWGLSNGGGDYRASYPTQFPNAVLSLAAGTDYDPQSGSTAVIVNTDAIDRNGFNIRVRYVANGGGVGPTPGIPVRWIAIGY